MRTSVKRVKTLERYNNAERIRVLIIRYLHGAKRGKTVQEISDYVARRFGIEYSKESMRMKLYRMIARGELKRAGLGLFTGVNHE